MSSQKESSRKAKPTRKKNKMAQKETKKTIKARDLKPRKDAKGGRRSHRGHQVASLSNQRDGPGVQGPGGGYGIHMVQ